jgi:beta-glucosidase
VDGAEVPQLYLTFPDAAGEPPLQLKGFDNVMIAAGAHKEVVFQLQARDFATWDVATHGWAVQSGVFNVQVGASSRDLRLSGTIKVPSRHQTHMSTVPTTGSAVQQALDKAIASKATEFQLPNAAIRFG